MLFVAVLGFMLDALHEDLNRVRGKKPATQQIMGGPDS